MAKHSMKKRFCLAVSGLYLALTFSQIAFGAQEPRAKNREATLTQTIPTAQESKAKEPDRVLTATVLTYQGQLKDANGPVNGVFDFQFVLYSAQTGGEHLSIREMKDSPLTNGMFSFKLDFGHTASEAKESWLEIGVRPSAGGEAYAVLFPRQKLTPTPYAIFAQHDQWSLIGVPVGFAGSAEKAAVLIDEIADQAVTEPKRITEETPKSSDPLKGKAADVESKAAAPNGVEWTQNGLNLYPTILGSNVGIGTMVPDTRLNVNSSAANSQAALTVSNGNADTRLALWSGFSAGANPPAILYTHDLRFGTVPAANFANGAGFAEAMRITRGGEVTIGSVLHLNNIGCAAGIGVVSPFTCSNYMLVGQTNGNTFINSSGAGGIHFRHNNVEADQMEIRPDGTTAVRVLQILGGADVSEQFDVSAPDTSSAESHKNVIDPGTVVSIDPKHPGRLAISTTAYDRRAAGIISGAGGVKPGMMMGQSGSIANGEHPVALTGRVYAWADTTKSPIEPGDLLTTSDIPGHAMKATDHLKAQGAIIGKAMTGLEAGRGLVLVLVTLQ